MKLFITLIGSLVCMMSLCNYGAHCQQQQQQQELFKDSSIKGAYSDQFVPLESMLLAPQPHAYHQKEAEQQHQAATKRALYKKMQKLVDELMREDQAERKLEKQLEQDKLLLLANKNRNMIKKKKTTTTRDPPTSFTTALQQESGTEEEADEEVVRKSVPEQRRQRKSNTLDLLLGALNNSVDGSSGQAGEQEALSRNLNSPEHARRILDDRFGIMKESKFTTNNHLGLKGVPKFGSDEEY